MARFCSRDARLTYPIRFYGSFQAARSNLRKTRVTAYVREIREELAIEVDVLGIYDVIYHRYPERAVLVLAYRCNWLSGEITDLDVLEHFWAPPCDIRKFELLPADIPLAEKICREFADADFTHL